MDGRSRQKHQKIIAEMEGFEPPIPVRVYLISNQTHSTTLAHFHSEGKIITFFGKNNNHTLLNIREINKKSFFQYTSFSGRKYLWKVNY